MNKENIACVVLICLAYFVTASTPEGASIHWSQWVALGAMILLAVWILYRAFHPKRIAASILSDRVILWDVSDPGKLSNQALSHGANAVVFEHPGKVIAYFDTYEEACAFGEVVNK